MEIHIIAMIHDVYRKLFENAYSITREDNVIVVRVRYSDVVDESGLPYRDKLMWTVSGFVCAETVLDGTRIKFVLT